MRSEPERKRARERAGARGKRLGGRGGVITERRARARTKQRTPDNNTRTHANTRAPRGAVEETKPVSVVGDVDRRR